MGLQFLLGRSGAGKGNYLVTEIRNKLIDNPDGPPIFYIVPDQMTFDEEYTLFNDKEISGSIRAQVVSFSRLAWRVLQETGGGLRPFISSVGMQMMLRKITEERHADWKVFQKALKKQGFLSELESMITEFKRHQITPEMLKLQMEEIDKFTHKEPNEIALLQKLDDLTYIYEQLVIAMQGQYIDGEDRLDLLAAKVMDATLLNDAEIYIDGFHRFTPQELHVIEKLMKKCKQVTVVLTMEKKVDPQALSELDLFYQTTETYAQLREIAITNNVPIKEDQNDEQMKSRILKRSALGHLERNFDVRPSKAFHADTPIQIAEAVHPRAEIEGVAQEIIHLTQKENYRYRDMAIFIRETDTYHDLIRTIFEDYDIPVFIDEKRTMLNHPLIEFIRSLLDTVESNWRYEAVFRLLKTGFIPVANKRNPLTDRAIDELENYVLEYGIRRREHWLDKEPWMYQRFHGFLDAVQTDREKETEQRINDYRFQVTSALGIFDESMREADTIQARCEAVYLLLEKVEVPKRLEKMREYYDQMGELEKGREQEQVWDAVVQLFDEIVEMAGSEEMSLSTFRSTLEAGLESLEFSHVPPSMDHVIVGTIDRSRISGVKCSFLLGVNEGVWPMKPPVDGMINEAERSLLAEHGIQLAESNRRNLLNDWFYIYLSFTAATDRLWVSYLISDEEGSTKIPSQLINRLVDLFPNMDEIKLLQDPDDLVEADRFITTPYKTRSALTSQLARYKNGYQVKPIWFHVLNWYMENHRKESLTYKVLKSLYYENKPTHLSKETVQELYPQKVKTSVSRLENYYRCGYQHFAQYSLGLQERKIFKLDAPDIGSLFHEALKVITEWVQADKRSFKDLTKKDTDQYAKKAISSLGPILQHQILRSTNRYQYIEFKLQEIIARAAFILSEQARSSGFSPIGIELDFGEEDTLQPLTLELPNGYELVLRGRIDRIDKAENKNSLYLRIIDYKSSETDLRLIDVYYGLALQMLVYLDVVLTQSETWLGRQAAPGGVLYFHVHNAMLSEEKKKEDSYIANELLKKYKMKGLLLSDEELIRLMDKEADGSKSKIVQAGIKKNGGLYSDSKVVGEETFTTLKQHIHRLMMQAGIEMTSGIIPLNPYEQGQKKACTFCPFKSVCQFDPILDENNFRVLKKMNDEEVLDNLQKGEEKRW